MIVPNVQEALEALAGVEEEEAPTGMVTVTVAAAAVDNGEDSNMEAVDVGQSWQWDLHEAMPMTIVSILWTRGSGHRISCGTPTW